VARLQLFIKVLREFKSFQKSKEMLLKDHNFTQAIIQVFDEFLQSRNIKLIIYNNKKSQHFQKASNIKPCKTADKGTGDGNISGYGTLPKMGGTTNLMFIDKHKEVLNLTSFNQSNLQNINKFYNIYNEVHYIKEEILKLFKQVIFFFFGLSYL